MIKDVVVNLPINSKRIAAADYATSVAKAFCAHITGIAFAYDARTDAVEAAEAAVARFETAAKASGLLASSRTFPATFVGAAELFGRIARRFDLSIVGQTERDEAVPDDLIIESALFDSGRPVIVVPYIQKQRLKLDRVLVGWDGGRNAARAIADALPFLNRAKVIDIVIVTTGRSKSDEVPGADIGHHLARHGVKVEIQKLVAPDVDVPNAILSYAADTSADFLVMGGYGHSRLREFVLGGATRGILTSMTIPVLISH
jgi:nucleotide-binding universal stress UspA family protein